MPAKGWRKTDNPKGNRLNIRVSEADKAMIYFICQDLDITISELFRKFLLDGYRKHLDRKHKEEWMWFKWLEKK